MIERKYICKKCRYRFISKVLEPGEAEEKHIRPVALRCPKCGGDVTRD